MCTVTIAIGAAIGAATSAATGGDLKSIALGAALGGASAGFSPGSFGITPGFDSIAGSGLIQVGSAAVNPIGLATAAAIGLGAGYVQNQLFATPEIPGYTPAAQQVQQFNSQQIATTGSGGRQASASLAEAIKRSKQRKLTQEDVGDLSIDTSSFASTGLQLA
jgi:hypothetical protein